MTSVNEMRNIAYKAAEPFLPGGTLCFNAINAALEAVAPLLIAQAHIEGMERALGSVWQCYMGNNHPAHGVGPDWDKALDGCGKLIEADIAKLKGRTGALARAQELEQK